MTFAALEAASVKFFEKNGSGPGVLLKYSDPNQQTADSNPLPLIEIF